MSAKHILVAYDFSEPSKRALEYASELRKALHCAVDVLYVFLDPFAEMKHPPKQSIWASPEQLQAHVRAVEEQTRAAVADVFGAEALAVTTSVVRGDPSTKILEKAAELEADLICIGSTGKSGVERVLLGSRSLDVLRQSPVPVLTVH